MSADTDYPSVNQIYGGAKALVNGDAGRALGDRAIKMSEKRSGQAFSGTAGDVGRFVQGIGGDLSGINPLTEGISGYDLPSQQEIDGWERARRASIGTASLAANGAAAVKVVSGATKTLPTLSRAARTPIRLVKPKACPATVPGKAGMLEGANFAQPKINKAQTFSPEGQAKYTALAGRPIKTVDDLAAALKDGAIQPSQLPIDYVVEGGAKVILNTRTSAALQRAGIPRSQWYGIDQTGKAVPGMPGTTYNDLARV
jgi:hypothetical protein